MYGGVKPPGGAHDSGRASRGPPPPRRRALRGAVGCGSGSASGFPWPRRIFRVLAVRQRVGLVGVTRSSPAPQSTVSALWSRTHTTSSPAPASPCRRHARRGCGRAVAAVDGRRPCRSGDASSPAPPLSVSLPWPPWMRSLPAPPSTVSSPLPPWMRSLPSPPLTVSLPRPPNRRSLPARPSILSFPALPKMRSASGVPVSVSSPEVPLRGRGEREARQREGGERGDQQTA